MRSVNLLSLVQAFESLNEGSFHSFLQHHNIVIKNDELADLSILTDILYKLKKDIRLFNDFYVSYNIPQIGKEFDLLRFGIDYTINVELKQKSTEERILKQLLRNKYYLSYLDNQIYNFTFVSETKEFYFLNAKDELEKIQVSDLKKLLDNQKCKNIENVDDLFNPSNYLVSPFNSTQKFIDNKYFLTQQQETIKNQILKLIENIIKTNFIAVNGSAGTGKTLLIYDIVKSLIEKNKKPLLIHCGNLNEGQEELIKMGWKILPIKEYKKYDLSKYDAVFIDEAQRIHPPQLNEIVKNIKASLGKCVFSYDKLQTLSKGEEFNNIDAKINNINKISTYKLSEKIRTNKEIAAFIKMLFNKKRKILLSNKGNIEINYFNNISDAKKYLKTLKSDDWEVLRFTPSRFNSEHHENYSSIRYSKSHEIIGQEFDNIALIIDQYFDYGENGDLIYKGKAYYDPVKMLFQNITRTRKKLNLVIISNQQLLNRCISILNS